jgi:hypothetical protein
MEYMMRTLAHSHCWGLLTLLVPLLAQAQTHSDAATPAAWAGSDSVDARPSSLRLTLQPSTDSLQLAFGEPRNCRLDARLTGTDEGLTQYDVTSVNGGRYCNQLYPGRVRLDVQGARATLQLGNAALPSAWSLWPLGQAPTDAIVPAELRGRWSTTVTKERIRMSLDLQAQDPGDANSTLVYESPRNCRVALRYEGASAGGSWYSVKPGNGGVACDRLVGRWIIVQASAEGASVRIEPALGEECVPSCALLRGKQ